LLEHALALDEERRDGKYGYQRYDHCHTVMPARAYMSAHRRAMRHSIQWRKDAEAGI
jgi:hypothetical protein